MLLTKGIECTREYDTKALYKQYYNQTYEMCHCTYHCEVSKAANAQQFNHGINDLIISAECVCNSRSVRIQQD